MDCKKAINHLFFLSENKTFQINKELTSSGKIQEKNQYLPGIKTTIGKKIPMQKCEKKTYELISKMTKYDKSEMQYTIF